MNKKRIAVIPARGGSKRIPLKNIAQINGIPMINYVLNYVEKSKLFDYVIVSTDSIQIENVVKLNSNKVIINGLRDSKLASDNVPVFKVLKYELEKIKQTLKLRVDDFDQVWLISATAVLLDSSDLIAAEKEYTQNESKAMLSVTKFPAPIEWALKIDEKNLLKAENPLQTQMNSQNFHESYFDSGCFAIFSPSIIEKFVDQVPISEFSAFILPSHKGIDVDTIEHLNLVSAILKD